MAEKYAVAYDLYGAKTPAPIIVDSKLAAENIASTIRKLERSATFVVIYGLYRGKTQYEFPRTNYPSENTERIAIKAWQRDFPSGVLVGKGEFTDRWKEIPMMGGFEANERTRKKLMELR